jgi:phage tail-like protein
MAGRGGEWRLSGANGWGAGLSAGRDEPVQVRADGVVAGRAALTLRPATGGPLDPTAFPVTAGGLAYPAAVSVRDDELLLAAAAGRRVMRWDGAARRFVPWIRLPVGGRGALVLQRAGDLLAVARAGSRRVTAIHPRAALVADDVNVPGAVHDLLARPSGDVLVLARAPGAATAEVWRWRPGHEGVQPAGSVHLPAGEDVRTRLLADAQGRVYVFESAWGRLLELGENGWLPVDQLRERFAPPRLAVEADAARGWRLRVPPDFGAEGAAAIPWPAPPAWPAFGPEGERLEIPVDAEVGRRPYPPNGTVEIGPLDATLPRTVWDRVELEIGALPAGTALSVETRTAEEPEEPLPDRAPWTEAQRIVGPHEGAADFAVQGTPARWLWLRLRMEGGGSTPSIHAATLAWPRGGVVDYLPAVYREEDEDTRFLERLVGALERTWAPLESAVDSFDRQMRPETAGAEMLGYLASWLDEPLDARWGTAARRAAVRAGARQLFRRGTPGAVRAAIRLHLANRWGVDEAALDPAPFVWEHFRSRLPARADVAGAAPGALFGAEVLRRLRLGASPLGEGTLRDLGSPQTDPVTLHAHRFSVVVPRALVPTPEDEQALRAVLWREQPAGAEGELVFIEPRMRLGAQSTLGVDTVLGVYPRARLAGEDGAGAAARLDYDCLLAEGEPGARPDTPVVGGGGAVLPWRIS